MRNCYALILFFCSIGLYANAKGYDTAYFHSKEFMLLELHANIAGAEGAEKKKLETVFFDSLYKVIHLPQAHLHAFDSAKVFGKISTKNYNLIIYNWNIPQSGGFNNYYCIALNYSKKEKKYLTTVFKEQPGFLNNRPKKLASTDNWPGALYYDIIPRKYKGKVFYTLLGFDFNNLLSNRKVIEVISIDEFEKVVFEPNMFLREGKVYNRLIFEYNERAQMMLNYNEKEAQIEFDHLSPMRPSLENQYQFYGPDLSYDALIFEDGIWKYQSDIQPGI